MAVEGRSNIERTVDAYERSIEAYVAASPTTPSEVYASFRQAVLALLPPHGRMLELGSGPGQDAEFFEEHGLEVQRTDATQGFVDRLRAQGRRAELLDITRDAFGGPFDIVFAGAVLLHLTTSQFGDVLARAAHAVIAGGLLAFTVKEGDGEAWSTAKLDHPRYFRYWRPTELEAQIIRAGWSPLRVDRVQGRLEPWLYAICRKRCAEPAISGGS